MSEAEHSGLTGAAKDVRDADSVGRNYFKFGSTQPAYIGQKDSSAWMNLHEITSDSMKGTLHSPVTVGAPRRSARYHSP